MVPLFSEPWLPEQAAREAINRQQWSTDLPLSPVVIGKLVVGENQRTVGGSGQGPYWGWEGEISGAVMQTENLSPTLPGPDPPPVVSSGLHQQKNYVIWVKRDTLEARCQTEESTEIFYLPCLGSLSVPLTSMQCILSEVMHGWGFQVRTGLSTDILGFDKESAMNSIVITTS